MSISVSDVTDILDTDVDDGAIQTYISQAGKLVSNDNAKTWLTAHLIRTSKDKGVDSEKINDVSIDYVGETGLGLDSTRYGQMAKLFDVEDELPTGKSSQVDISGWN